MLNEKGHEIPDPIPAAIPLQWQRPPTLQEQIKSMIRREMSQAAAQDGLETFEEADDFDVGDDFDPQSPYEVNYDPPSIEGTYGPNGEPAAPVQSAGSVPGSVPVPGAGTGDSQAQSGAVPIAGAGSGPNVAGSPPG